MENSKLSIIMVGHVDHGKSTLIGRLLYDTHSVSDDKITELEKASNITDNKLEFAFLLDHLREEREQGITIDTTQIFFKSKNREYQIIDAPGHVEFVKNMITGATQASSAVLIIDAVEGVMQQTKRHSYILSLLGMKHLVVVVNKMDKVDYSEKNFTKIVKDVTEVFQQLNMHVEEFIPVSALYGDNVCNVSLNMPWYHGKPLLEVIEKIEPLQEKEDSAFILPIQDVYKQKDKRIAIGRLEAGILNTGQKVQIIQSGQHTRIRSIEKFLENTKEAHAGECIGITTEDSLFIDRGNIICNDATKITYESEFGAKLIWMDKKPVHINEKLVVRCDTQETTCVIKEIQHKINTDQLVEVEKNAEQLDNLDAGKVIIKLKHPLAFAKYVDYKCIGRFVLLRQNNICAGGIIV